MKYFSRRANVQFCHVPKAACTAVKLALLATDGIECRPPSAHEHKQWKEPFAGADLVFTVVRHPLARLASCWRDKVVANDPGRLDFPLKQGAPFREFADWVPTAERQDQHWRPQVDLLPERVDLVCKFEHLAAEWETLRRMYGLAPLPKVNDSPPADIDVTGVNWPALVEFYAKDFERFGYERAWPIELQPGAWRHVPGFTTDVECQALQDAAAGVDVLELGVFKGKTTLAMAAVANRVVAVDHFAGDGFVGRCDTASGAWSEIVKHGGRERVTLVAGRIVNVLSRFDLVELDRFGLIHVDADHTYGATVQTLGMLTGTRATIAVHDYGTVPAVTRAVDLAAKQNGVRPRVVERLAFFEGKGTPWKFFA